MREFRLLWCSADHDVIGSCFFFKHRRSNNPNPTTIDVSSNAKMASSDCTFLAAQFGP